MKEVLLTEALSAHCNGGSIFGNTVLPAGVNHSNSPLSLVLWSTYMSRDLPPQVWCWDNCNCMRSLWDEALCQHEIRSSFTLTWKTLREAFLKFSHGLRGIYQTLQQEGFCLLSFLTMFGNKWQTNLPRKYPLWGNVPFSLTERATWLDIVVSPEKRFYFSWLSFCLDHSISRGVIKNDKKIIKSNTLCIIPFE